MAVISLTLAGVQTDAGGTTTVVPYAEAGADLLRAALDATPRWARDNAPARMAFAALAGRIEQIEAIAQAQRAENAALREFAATRINRASVAVEQARDRLLRAQQRVAAADRRLAKIPGGTNLAANREKAINRLNKDGWWTFPALARKLRADDELLAAQAALPAIEAEYAEAHALAAPNEVAAVECGVREIPDGEGNAAVRAAAHRSGLSTREFADRIGVNSAFLRRIMRGSPQIGLDDPLVARAEAI